MYPQVVPSACWLCKVCWSWCGATTSTTPTCTTACTPCSSRRCSPRGTNDGSCTSLTSSSAPRKYHTFRNKFTKKKISSKDKHDSSAACIVCMIWSVSTGQYMSLYDDATFLYSCAWAYRNLLNYFFINGIHIVNILAN